MFLSCKKQNSKPQIYQSSEATGKNYILKANSMSPMAKLMATFYRVDSK
jgi:hypothetical protein